MDVKVGVGKSELVEIDIVIPSSILSVEQTLMFKTIRIYQIIRYSSIFRVRNIYLYRDPYTHGDVHKKHSMLFKKIHRYLLTPPYLRKKLIPLDNDLRYVGILPPLRLKVFDVSHNGRVGEYRYGVLTGDRRIYIGLEKEFIIVNIHECHVVDGVVRVRIKSLDPPLVYCVEKKYYEGPHLQITGSFRELIHMFRERKYYLIATSRFGRIPSFKDIIKLNLYRDIILFFGSPKHGLYEIAREEGLELEEIVDTIWNTIPGQMVKTVRTEEALIATLSILNLFVNG